ncbi:MAG: Rieske 2Fe-2S domain-containing protein [Rhodospirillales bacterium]|nr:Rieske 2Fe-2S domain-containing protein [Rhodospirillales bacterium]
MTAMLSAEEFARLTARYDPDPGRSHSLGAHSYIDPRYLEIEREAIFYRTWQWVCHIERLREPGDYVVTEVQGRSIAVVHDRNGVLRAFYNVCKHRAHHLLSGHGRTNVILCPYHAWSYDLEGRLRAAPNTGQLENFDKREICLESVQVEAFCGFVYVNLDPKAPSLAGQSGDLAKEIMAFAPDVEQLTLARRLTFRMQSNWKNVIDNFLECYHCPHAHKDLCSLVDMDSYKVTTHGIYSSQMAKANKQPNSAYSIEGATVDDLAVWWLWPNTCLLRYPGRGNFQVMHIAPISADCTYETYDFYFETAVATPQEEETIAYVRDVLQKEDIDLVESVQRGMATPAFESGRIVNNPSGSGKSEHGVHHFHGLMIDAYRRALA